MTTISAKAHVTFAALAMLVAVSSASADLSGISDVIFRIEATNATGTGFIEVTKDQLVYHPTTDSYHWNLPASLVIFDDLFNPIATLQNANLAILKNATKKIAGAFAVQAGDSETTFDIQLPQLSFGTLIEPLTMGRMGLACNVTDLGADGVAMRALSTGAGMLRGDYNGLVPGGTMFAQVLYQVAATSGSGSGYQNFPAAGYADIASAVSDMSSRLDFTLTAGDLGGGTHYYEIVPEPASLGLLLIGIAALAVRRR